MNGIKQSKMASFFCICQKVITFKKAFYVISIKNESSLFHHNLFITQMFLATSTFFLMERKSVCFSFLFKKILKCDQDDHCEITVNSRHVCSYCRLAMIRSCREKPSREKSPKMNTVQTT